MLAILGLITTLPLIGQVDSADAYVVLSPVTITPLSLYEFNAEARREYRRTRYHALKVYPYAIRAIELMGELEEATADMDRKREKKRFRKDLEKELKNDFKEELKMLSRRQGTILIDMIERHSDQAFYDILKQLKSGTTAFFWHGIGKNYGYDLKAGYDPVTDPVLEDILSGLEWPAYVPGEDMMHKQKARKKDKKKRR